ncbi:hypothetical protein [uncultured Rikenella sp.]|uniref:hypothetical protein n=1 Tax=uncultured Rikenella sp. TaxID=368003 RepID=UPI002629B669|nr:hypothetical protein [uncultured Rikenella sp.]
MPLGRDQHPAPGCRGSGEGKPGGSNNNACIWSATSYDSEDRYLGMYLYFGTQGLSSCHTTGQASGHQLRCLSE